MLPFQYSDGTDEDVFAPVFAFTDDTELNYITAQRRLAYYMLSKNAGRMIVPTPPYQQQPVAKQLVEVDSFKFDYLSGGGYGFAVRIPEQQSTQSTAGHKSKDQRSLQSFEEARRDLGLTRRKVSPAYAVDLEDDSLRERLHQPHSVLHGNLRNHGKGPGHEIFSRHIGDLRRSRGQALASHGEQTGSLTEFDGLATKRSQNLRRTRSDHTIVARDTFDSIKGSLENKSHSAGGLTRSDGPEFVPSVLPSYSRTTSQ